MSSIAQTESRRGRRNFNLRAYLAGTAATAALLGAVVITFASLGAYVAFNGLPIGGGDSAAQPTSVSVGQAATEISSKSRPSQNVAPADVRNSQASRGDSAGASGHAAATPDSTAPAGTDTATSTPTGQTTVTATGAQPTVTAAPTQGGSDTSPAGPITTPHVTTPDSVGGTVGTVEQTLHDAGVDIPLGGAGSAVDDAANQLLGGN
jgi:hypothetical protein